MGGVMVEYGELLCSGLDSQIHRRQATGMAPASFRSVLRVCVLAIGDEQIGASQKLHQSRSGDAQLRLAIRFRLSRLHLDLVVGRIDDLL